jgi:hypothetical protein
MSEQAESPEPDAVPHEAGVPEDAVAATDLPAEETAPDGAASPTVAPRTMGWRDESLGTALVTTVAGIWLIFSPEALGYGSGDATWNPVVCGVLIVVFSIGRIIRPGIARGLGLILFVIGAGLVVSAFILDAPPSGQLNQAGFGGIVALLSLIGIAGAQRGRELNPQ